MKKNKKLWEFLNLSSNFNSENIYDAYKKIKLKTKNVKLAYKVLHDPFYADIYKNHLDIDFLTNAGFIVDKLKIDGKDIYNLNFLSTPFGKILDNINSRKKNVVLLSTGGFDPIHAGHLNMMESAKLELERKGYNVVGGYFSLSHDDYVKTKPYVSNNIYERIYNAREVVKDSSWLMIDPWESLYAKTYLNFTDVILRLKNYLNKHLNLKIEVAYVFGADNAKFMYCFKNKGIGVCLNRSGFEKEFEETKLALENERCLFIENKKELTKLSSRLFRQNNLKIKPMANSIGSYVIRNEGLFPLMNYLKITNKNKLLKLQNWFFKKIINLFKNTFKNLKISSVDLNKQLELVKKSLDGKKSISLDTYFQGTNNLEISRLFEISDYQNSYVQLIARPGCKKLENQVENIRPSNYVLVDDDSVSGKTINSVLNILPKDVVITDKLMLTSIINERIFDVVDLRDFIVGSLKGGLIVRYGSNSIARVPYVLPYVCLKTRANIDVEKEKNFSIKIWKLNLKLFKKLGKEATLKLADKYFIKLMESIGFNENTPMATICCWHLKRLK